MGPGTTQILRISGFVQFKTGKENGTLFPDFQVIFKKKRSSPSLKGFFSPYSGDIKPSRGPFKPMGPGVIVPPAPPLVGPASVQSCGKVNGK